MKKRKNTLREIQKKHRLFKLTYLPAYLMTLAVLSCIIWGAGRYQLREAEAAAKQPETVDIRIIGTTDLHGQLNSKDYEQGVDYNNGGLARVMDLITKTRSELPRENTVTLDAGDVLFDYTTEYIFSENQNELQPIYKAMAQIGYDAITLGNHEFDYGWDYLQRQLNDSGLRDITVVSNLMNSKDSSYPFLENMLITRKVKTSAGKEIEVKIGIIGQTIPTLTSKTHSYAGILKTEDMVLNAKTQAVKLKEMGADIVIALSHTGIGPEKPELNFKNVAYALTKIPQIDVVVCGHEHNLFPTKDMTSPYYKLPNVDKTTYLMNGKNVIMAGDRGEAIGVVDLTLEVNGNKVEVANRKSELRMVTAENTKENKAIASSFGDWEERLLEYSTDVLGALGKGEVIQNFYGLLGDNSAIQLLNESKINYAVKYKNTTGLQYKNYPVIAASSYSSFGANSINDFVQITDQITESDLTTIQPYNNYLYIYTISGKQLREWLEWTASAYETVSSKDSWKNQTMASLMKENNIKSLIREDWLDDWSNFHVFDGIDYVIDPTMSPRYDFSGNKISTSRRIKSIKYNGTEVQDNTMMLIATNKITKPTEANKGIEKQAVLSGFIRSQSILGKYIEQIAASGEMIPQLDYNWRVSFPGGYQFLVKAPHYADELIKASPWYLSSLIEKDNYKYYIASYPVENGDKNAPGIVVTPLVTSATATPFDVAVNVSDASELKYVRMVEGNKDIDYSGWPVAKDIKGQNFRVWENGTYTIYAEDIHGNKSVKHLVIDNFSDNLLAAPVIDSYTNRKSKISGKAEPNSTIVFEAYTGRYESKVSVSGKFSYGLPSQPSATSVYVYVKDEERGLESERVQVTVKRTGPNQPTINPIYNYDNYISGSTKDSDASVIVVSGDKVYVPKDGGKALYEKNTEIYDAGLEIIEVDFEVSGEGNYVLMIPPQVAGSTVTVYSLDHLSRNSRVNTAKIVEIAPNAPIVYEVSNIEKSIRGYVPSGANMNVTLTLGSNTYEAVTDKNGNFLINFRDQLTAGQSLTVTASDTKNGALRRSFPTKVIVEDIEDYVRTGKSSLTINRLTDKSNLISGYNYDGGNVYIAISEGKGSKFMNSIVSVATDDTFRYSYDLEEKLKSASRVYVMTRYTDGEILLANAVSVLAGRPEMPSLVKEVTNTDKLVEVIADQDCEVTLKIGKKTYTSKDYQYDEMNNRYIYAITIDRELSGASLTLKATNVSGTSDVFTSSIGKVAPESPVVNTVKAGAKKITGKVELLDYVTPTDDLATEGNEVKVPEVFKGAPAKVAQTQTRIYAQIGKKTYEGKIDKKGNFVIVTPELKAGSTVKIWGTNKAGRGPLTAIKVVTK